MDEKTKVSTQRVFDEALKHIRKQREPCYKSGQCLYSYNEKGCAFAPAIEHYDDEMDTGYTASDMLNDWSNQLHDWAKDCDPFIADEIQCCHDRVARRTETNEEFLMGFEDRMKEVSIKFDLKYTDTDPS